MRAFLLSALLLMAVMSTQSQTTVNSPVYTYIQTIDSLDTPAPDLRLAPWYGQISLGMINVDTVRVVMILGKIKTYTTSTSELTVGPLEWRKGYFVNSKSKYLDTSKKPIATNYRVFSTFPWW